MNFNLWSYADLKVDIDRNSDSYCRTVNRLNKDDMVVELNRIDEMFKKAIENSDNKVQLAMQMYEMVRKGLGNVVWGRGKRG